MKRVLITGATGNIGSEVIHFLFEKGSNNEIIAGVRDIEKAKKQFNKFTALSYTTFDFKKKNTYAQALSNTDCLFLLRPPNISDVKKYIRPLIEEARKKDVKEIVFLSVQGAEKSKIIPHNKIEKLIKEYDINHIFIRPSYFMQNLTTTLFDDIHKKGKIILPAGKAKFNWIDAKDIGEVSAIFIEEFEKHKNIAYEITGYENKNFYEVAEIMTQTLKRNIEYKRVNPFRFYRIKRKDNIPGGLIMVMIFLHFLPRFQKKPKISHIYEKLTGKKPGTLIRFVKRERNLFNN